jgi:hypothetical protein
MDLSAVFRNFGGFLSRITKGILTETFGGFLTSGFRFKALRFSPCDLGFGVSLIK